MTTDHPTYDPLPCHEAAARELLEALEDGGCRSVMVCAPAAAGKTALCRWALRRLEGGRTVVEWAGGGTVGEAGALPAWDGWCGGGSPGRPPVVFFDDADVAVRAGSKGACTALAAHLSALPPGSKVLLTCTTAPGRPGGGVPTAVARAVGRRVTMPAPGADDVAHLLRALFPGLEDARTLAVASEHAGDVRAALICARSGLGGTNQQPGATGGAAAGGGKRPRARARASQGPPPTEAAARSVGVAGLLEAASLMDAYSIDAPDDLLPRISDLIRGLLKDTGSE